ncbi:hypothetical protein SAMN02745166_00968 [Prosthecobacter debontii]|uniref:Uncharacterized protein n=1 Tax=Prosthecobacter debontii TaxID=48467 RepID=A0A1T4X304_9BACT|nr:hypothetical protein SAMN02745166_00968 [Prosthecobacter debontii]
MTFRYGSSGHNRGLLELIVLTFEGWCYVISPQFRRKKHQEWRKTGGAKAVFYGVASRLLGFGFSLLMPAIVWFSQRD